MPFKNDTRRTVTLNLPAVEHAALSADATRAGHASPGLYALALVRGRGAALRPVVVENGARRVAVLQRKRQTATAELAVSRSCWPSKRR